MKCSVFGAQGIFGAFTSSDVSVNFPQRVRLKFYKPLLLLGQYLCLGNSDSSLGKNRKNFNVSSRMVIKGGCVNLPSRDKYTATS